MTILVLNSGSSSLKFQLLEGPNRLAKGEITRIGESVPTHEAALAAVFDQLKRTARLEDIAGVGHRVVHGGDYFNRSVVIDAEALRRIQECSGLAPLHNPHNLKGYFAAKQLLPNSVQVAVFDTAFHHTIPERAYLYGLPYDLYTGHKIRRYGFHGTSFRYVSGRFAEIQGRADRKLIVLHLGNGCSVCAIREGQSIDTSMGFTPLEGLLMGTRPGDVDPGALTYLMETMGKTSGDLDHLLNERSGLLGVSGVSNDIRDVLQAEAQNNPRAAAAIEVFCYRAAKYIGAYFAALDGADAIIFTAGIGEHSPAIRARICASLSALGIALDPARNEAAVGKEMAIGLDGKSPSVWVIPTDEELLIARDTAQLVQQLRAR